MRYKLQSNKDTTWFVVPKPTKQFIEQFGQQFSCVGHVEQTKPQKWFAVAYQGSLAVTRNFRYRGKALKWVAAHHTQTPVVFVAVDKP